MNQLILSIAYVLPIAFVIWLWLGNRLGIKGKTIFTLLLPLIYVFHWYGLQQSKGWPSDSQLPEKFELISADIVEPNPLKSIEGNIHLWIRPQVDSNKTKPRAYILPYSRELHKSLFETKQRAAQGRAQMGLLYSEEAGGRGASIGNGRKLDFQDVPSRRLPPKI